MGPIINRACPRHRAVIRRAVVMATAEAAEVSDAACSADCSAEWRDHGCTTASAIPAADIPVAPAPRRHCRPMILAHLPINTTPAFPPAPAETSAPHRTAAPTSAAAGTPAEEA